MRYYKGLMALYRTWILFHGRNLFVYSPSSRNQLRQILSNLLFLPQTLPLQTFWIVKILVIFQVDIAITPLPHIAEESRGEIRSLKYILLGYQPTVRQVVQQYSRSGLFRLPIARPLDQTFFSVFERLGTVFK